MKMRALRRLRTVVLALLGGVSGCLTAGQPEHPPPPFADRPFSGPTGGDVVQIDVAVLERPLGDRFLNRELWELADEQAITLEQKAVLDDNGFRVCQIGGLPPAGLQALLTSERSCPDPRRV